MSKQEKEKMLFGSWILKFWILFARLAARQVSCLLVIGYWKFISP